MKKIKNLICSILIIVCFVHIIPNTSYGICNTFRFSKEVSAVQLTLANGAVLSNLKVEKKLANQTQVSPNAFKELNLVIIVETSDEIYKRRKDIKPFINKVYDLYGQYAYKVKTTIVPFNDIATGYNNYKEINYKNSKEEVFEQIDNLKQEDSVSLSGALNVAVTTRGGLTSNIGGKKNEEIAQQLVILTDGVDNEEELYNARAILNILNENMVAMWTIIYEKMFSEEKLNILIEGIEEMQYGYSEYITIGNLLENDVYDDIVAYVIDNSGFMPSRWWKRHNVDVK